MSDSENAINEKNYGIGQVISSVHSIRDEVGNNVDKVVGLEFFENAKDVTDEEVEAELRKIRFKVDIRLMPILCITYTLQFLDKLSLNYASAYSFKEDLGLVGQRYSWVAAIFNFGYMLWAFPSNCKVHRRHACSLGYNIDWAHRCNELWWHVGSSIYTRNVRSRHFPVLYDDLRYVLFQRRPAFPYVHVFEL